MAGDDTVRRLVARFASSISLDDFVSLHSTAQSTGDPDRGSRVEKRFRFFSVFFLAHFRCFQRPPKHTENKVGQCGTYVHPCLETLDPDLGPRP